MSSTAQWLARLNRATDYVDLQAMFQELLADLQDGANHAELATAIDEAIRRLEIERLRDTHELESFEQEFAQFREQQRGLVGWFRRHLPYSRTKRAEREQRESIADQQAELLADNLIIARAQMVKERLLPAPQRKMGVPAEQWRSRIQAGPNLPGLTNYAAEVQQLCDEIEQSQQFLKLVADDVEAFARADFTAAVDEQRQRVDLAAARQELAELQQELEQEVGLRSWGLHQLGDLVSQDVAERDPEYRRRVDEAQRLGRARERGLAVAAAAAQLQTQLQRLLGLEQEQFELPRVFQQMEQEANRFRQQADEARTRQQHLNQQLAEQSNQFESANRSVVQARSAFDAARRVYEAYIREQGVAELDPQTAASPVFGEYQRQEQSLKNAESLFQRIAAPFQNLQIEVGDLGRMAEVLARSVEEVLRRQQGNSRRQREVQDALANEYQRVRPLWERLVAQTEDYFEALATLERPSTLPRLDGFQDLAPLSRAPRTLPGFPGADRQHRRRANATQDNYELIQRLHTGIERELEQLGQALAATNAELRATWEARARELLDPKLAEAVITAQP